MIIQLRGQETDIFICRIWISVKQEHWFCPNSLQITTKAKFCRWQISWSIYTVVRFWCLEKSEQICQRFSQFQFAHNFRTTSTSLIKLMIVLIKSTMLNYLVEELPNYWAGVGESWVVYTAIHIYSRFKCSQSWNLLQYWSCFILGRLFEGLQLCFTIVQVKYCIAWLYWAVKELGWLGLV